MYFQRVIQTDLKLRFVHTFVASAATRYEKLGKKLITYDDAPPLYSECTMKERA